MSAGSIPTELGTKPVGELLRQYAVPGIIAMTASSLYNMVDSIFIGHIADVGPMAISGLAVTFPLMNISTAFGTLVGVGAATMISVLLGQKNYDVANKVLSNDVTLNILTGVVFTLVTLLWMNPILRFFGASDATLPFARDYMTIIALGNAVTHLYFGLNAIVRSSGNPRLAMGLTLFTVTSNAILDPIFIYTLGLGIQGAALATVLCQSMALGYTMWYFLDGRTILLEERLLSPWASPGRRRFTLMHEVSHRLLSSGGSRSEGEADRLAAALLMPRALVERNLLALGWLPGPLPDRRLDPERWRIFAALAETMGVSRRALAIRLEELGLTEQRPGWVLRPVPAPVCGETEE